VGKWYVPLVKTRDMSELHIPAALTFTMAHPFAHCGIGTSS